MDRVTKGQETLVSNISLIYWMNSFLSVKEGDIFPQRCFEFLNYYFNLDFSAK